MGILDAQGRCQPGVGGLPFGEGVGQGLCWVAGALPASSPAGRTVSGSQPFLSQTRVPLTHANEARIPPLGVLISLHCSSSSPRRVRHPLRRDYGGGGAGLLPGRDQEQRGLPGLCVGEGCALPFPGEGAHVCFPCFRVDPHGPYNCPSPHATARSPGPSPAPAPAVQRILIGMGAIPAALTIYVRAKLPETPVGSHCQCGATGPALRSAGSRQRNPAFSNGALLPRSLPCSAIPSRQDSSKHAAAAASRGH